MKGWLIKLFDLYIYSSIHIALCAVSFTLYTYYLVGKEQDLSFLTFVGASTICLYSLHRIIGMDRVGPYGSSGRFAIIKSYKVLIYILGILGGLIAIWIFLTFDMRLKLLLIIPSVLSLFYVLPLFSKGLRLRDISYVKIFILSICWAWFTGVLPSINTGYEIELFISRALFIFAITIPFEFRDKEVDRSSGVKTLAHVLEGNTGIYLALASIILSLSIIICFTHIHPSFIIIEVSAQALTIILISFSIRVQHDYYYSFLLDASMMLFLIGYLVIKS